MVPATLLKAHPDFILYVDENSAAGILGCGDVTFAPDGSGHGISNTGSDVLKFIALIVLD